MEDYSTAVKIYLTVFSLFYLLGCSRNSVEAAPTTAVKKNNPEVDYLTKYGYLSRKAAGTGDLMDQQNLVSSLKRLQRFAGLNETGKLDAATIKLMGQSRCGVKDFGPADKARRRRRYVLQGTQWKKKTLTFRIKTFTRDLSKTDQKRVIKWAFDLWSKSSQMSVTEAPSSMSDDKVDIIIRFVKGRHGDGFPFDGPGGTLAHAFYPHDNSGIAGDAHFDDDENFTTGKRKGVNLDWVALHEFGHSLGLEHSRVRDSVMYPWYKGFFKNIELTTDDIRGIQHLYGGPLKTKEPPSSNPFTGKTRPKKPECDVKSFDAWVYSNTDKETYAFIGKHYFIVDPDTVGVLRGPLEINDKWKEVQTPIDAAYARTDEKIVFFRKGTYWKYNRDHLEEGPKPISDYGLPKELENMNGAFVWGRNSRTYFWKGDKYWRYDERYRKIDSKYPKDVSAWKKIPSNIDSVMKWKNERTYFFKGTKIYKLDDYVIAADANYPKDVLKDWMKCEQSKLKVESTARPTGLFVNTTRSSKKAAQEGGGSGEGSGGHHVLPSILIVMFGVLTAARLV